MNILSINLDRNFFQFWIKKATDWEKFICSQIKLHRQLRIAPIECKQKTFKEKMYRKHLLNSKATLRCSSSIKSSSLISLHTIRVERMNVSSRYTSPCCLAELHTMPDSSFQDRKFHMTHVIFNVGWRRSSSVCRREMIQACCNHSRRFLLFKQ